MVPTTFIPRPPECMANGCHPKHHPGKFDILNSTLIMGNKCTTFYLFMYWQRNCHAIGVYLIVYINQWQTKLYVYTDIEYIPYNICTWFCLCFGVLCYVISLPLVWNWLIFPGEIWMTFLKSNFQANFSVWWLWQLLGICPQTNVSGPKW